jgi:hypothetical protein
MNINGADVMNLSFLNQLKEERKAKRKVPAVPRVWNGWNI